MASQNETKSVGPHIGRSVSLDHAAAMLGVSRRTIYNRIREGRLQTVRTLGSSKRVLVESLLEMQGGNARAAWVGEGRSVAADTSTSAATRRSHAPHNPGEAHMDVKTEIKAGRVDESIVWGL